MHKNFSPRSVLIILILLGAFHASFYYMATSDDAFISLRYSRNLLEGFGPVYNVGESPVEGHSNPLFVTLCAALLALGIPDLWALKGLGLASFLGTIALLIPLSRRLLRQGNGPALTAAFLCATSPFLAFWAMAGLETCLYAFLILLGIAAGIKDLNANRAKWAPIVFVLVTTTRPEGVLLAGLAGLALWLAAEDRRLVLRGWLVGFVLPVVLLECARLMYYGDWVPNTFHVKVLGNHHPGRLAAGYGARFLLSGGIIIAVPALIALVSAFRVSPRPRWLGLVVAVLFGHGVFLLVAGGDFMPAFRFIMPVYPILCMLAGGSLWQILGKANAQNAKSAIVVVSLGLFVFGAQLYALDNHGLRFWMLTKRSRLSYMFETELLDTWLEGHSKVALYLRTHSNPEDKLAITEAGRVPFAAGLMTIDMLGLNHREIAALWKETDSSEIADVKVARYVFDLAPRWVMLDGHFDSTGGFIPRLKFAQHLVAESGWDEYCSVFSAEVYSEDWSPNGNARINVLFERKKTR